MQSEEFSQYQTERDAKKVQEDRRFTTARLIFADLCMEDNHRHPNRDGPQDFAAMATVAVEAADMLLIALQLDPNKIILPDVETLCADCGMGSVSVLLRDHRGYLCRACWEHRVCTDGDSQTQANTNVEE